MLLAVWRWFFQRQGCAASRRNFFHIGRRVRQANYTEAAHQRVALSRDNDVVVIRRRKKRAPVAPARIAHVAEIFGVHRKRRRTRRRTWICIHRNFRNRWRRWRGQRRAENVAVRSLIFQREESLQNV